MKTRLGNTIYKLAFFKVISGKEFQIVQILKSKLELANIHHYQIFKILGEFDIMLIYPHQEAEGFLYQGTIPSVISSVGFNCFTIEDNQERFELTKFNNPLLGITFFKIKPRLFSEFEAADLLYMKIIKLRRQIGPSENIVIYPLGSLGWSDVIGLVGGDSIIELIETIDNLSEVQAYNKGKHQRVALKTYSFVGIKYDQVQALTDGKRTKIKNDNIGTISPIIEISCRPDSQNMIINELHKVFKHPPKVSIGKEDLIQTTVETDNWVSFLRDLLRLRRKNEGKMISTCVRILKEVKHYEEGEVNANYIAPPSPPSDKLISMLPRNDLSRTLLSNIYTLDHLCQNDLIAGDVQSMVPMGHLLVKRFIGLRQSESKDYSDLDNSIRLFEGGINQRIIGAFLASENLRSGLQYHIGGIQKILSAAEVVARQLLRVVGIKWNGFVIFGSAPDYRHDNEIISLPIMTWLDPASWWGEFHEIGHIFELRNKKCFNDSVYKRYLTPLVEAGNSETDLNTPLGKAFRYAQEIIADTFDYMMGWLQKENAYLTTIWKYLSGYHYESKKMQEYLCRSASVLLIRNSDPARATEAEIESLLNRIMMQIYPVMAEHGGLSGKIDFGECIDLLQRLKPFLGYVHQVMSQYDGALDTMTRYYGSSEFDGIWRRINGEGIYSGKIPYPHLLVLRSILKKKEGTVAFRIALIKTLWYQGVR